MEDVAFVKDCEIDVPDPDEAPLIFGADTVQLKVVPLTPFGLVILMALIAWPLHIDCDAGNALTVGTGFTVTVCVTGVPEHPFAAGVIV